MSGKSLRKEMVSRKVFKAWAIEENLDRYFFRPVAVVFTSLFHRLGMTPNAVSLLGMVIGMCAAVFVMSPALAARLCAVGLLWLAEVLDAADGQLARLTSNPSPYGRVMDGFCSAAILAVVYGMIGAGLFIQTGRWFYIPLAGLTLASHGLHSVFYDFYRSEYIRIVEKRQARNSESPAALARARRAVRGEAWFWQRVLLFFHHQFALRQVWATPTYQPLVGRLEAGFAGGPVSPQFARCYRERQRPLVRWWNYLGPNAHLILLTACLLARRLEWVFWVNVVGFNLYALVMTWRQKSTTEALLRDLALATVDAPLPAAATGRALAGVP